MGLLYQFPVNTDETDYYQKENDTIIVKSYGLPIIFWFYFAGSMIVFAFLTLGVLGPVKKLLSYTDLFSQILAYGMIALLVIIPLSLIAFFFYEKRLTKSADHIKVQHCLFGWPFRSIIKTIKDIEVHIGHFLDSPNMARLQNNPESRGFQNKGYFEFYLTSANQKILIDRSSRKIDLEHLKKLLEL